MKRRASGKADDEATTREKKKKTGDLPAAASDRSGPVVGTSKFAIFLRGINVGSGNRLNMAELRTALESAGFTGVQTLQAAGNVVACGGGSSETVRAQVQRVLEEEFSLDVPVSVRTSSELVAVIDANPFQEEARTDPKHLQVAFFPDPSTPPPANILAKLENPSSFLPEKFSVHGQELYTWHPEGIARSKLWAVLGAKSSPSTSRNWNTVTSMLALLSKD